jgi:hypothetical protein
LEIPPSGFAVPPSDSGLPALNVGGTTSRKCAKTQRIRFHPCHRR